MLWNLLKIELYFAINAIDRLDNNGEKYYNQSFSSNKDDRNGFFIRDDIPQDNLLKLRSYDPLYQWHSSNTTNGLLHVEKVAQNNSNLYFGPDRIQIKQADHSWDKYSKVTDDSDPGKGAEMSQDHLIGVLFALKCVQKFVDWDLVVDPDGINTKFPSKNLVTWTAEISKRLMQHLSKTSYDVRKYDAETDDNRAIEKCKKENNCNKDVICTECDEEDEWGMYKRKNKVFFSSAKYVLSNPAENDRHVWRGPYAFSFGYPLELIGEKLANANSNVYLNFPSAKAVMTNQMEIKNSAPVQLVAGTIGSVFGIGLFGVTKAANNVIDNDDEWGFTNNTSRVKDFVLKCPGLSLMGTQGASICLFGMELKPESPAFWRCVWNAIPEKDLIRSTIKESGHNMANNMILKLAAMTGSWNHESFNSYANYMGYIYHDLIYAVLNNKKPIKSKNDYMELLKKADKYGVFDGLETSAPFNRGCILAEPINSEIEFKHNDKYNGNDFMFLYNLYRISDILYWGTNQNKIVYKESSAPFPTESGVRTKNITHLKHLSFIGEIKDVDNNGTITQRYVFPTALPFVDKSGITISNVNTSILDENTLKLGIRLPEHLSHDLTLNANTKVTVKYDLFVNGSKLELKSGSELETTSPPNGFKLTNIVKIQKGCSLILNPYATLRIADNTEVIIEEGAKMIYSNYANIILDGPNSVLKFDQGQLELESGAIFNVQEGPNGRGYLHFNFNWKENGIMSNVYSKYRNTKFLLEGPYTNWENYANYKLIQITGDVGLNVDWNIKSFEIRNGFIALGKDSRLTSNALYTEMKRCNFNIESNAEKDILNKHNGIEIPGRFNYFEDVVFRNANVGVSFYNRGGQEILKMEGCSTIFCTKGIEIYGNSMKLNNCVIHGSYRAIDANGVSGTTKIRGSALFLETSNARYSLGTKAMRYHGAGHLYLWNNSFLFGHVGIDVYGANLRLKCNRFDWNGVNMIWAASPNVSMIQGYNKFSPSSYASQHILGYGNTYLSLKDNYNLYARIPNIDNKVSSGLYFNLSISKRSPWNTTNIESDGANSGYMDNMRLISMNNIDPTYQIKLKDYLPPLQLGLASSPNVNWTINQTIENFCTEANERLPFDYNSISYDNVFEEFGDVSVAQLLRKPSSNPLSIPVKISGINVVPAINEGIGIVVQRNFDRLFADSAGPYIQSTIAELSNVLTQNTNRPDLKLSPALEEMYMAFDLFNQAYTIQAFAVTDSTKNTFDRTLQIYPKVDSVYSELWSQSQDTASLWHYFKFEIIQNWAQVNRLCNNKSKAIEILELGITSLNDDYELNILNDWKCLNEMEIALQSDSALSLEKAISLYLCSNTDELRIDSLSIDEISLSFCDWSGFGKESALTYFETDTFLTSIFDISSVMTREIALRTDNTYKLKSGKYLLSYYNVSDTHNYSKIINVSSERPDTVYSDTTLYYVNKDLVGVKSGIIYQPSIEFEYEIINDSTGDFETGLLVKGSYTVEVEDTLNCIRKIIHLNVESTNPSIITSTDTSLSYCSLKWWKFGEFIGSIVDDSTETYRILGADSISSVDSITTSRVDVLIMDDNTGTFRMKSIYTSIERPLLQSDSDTTVFNCKFTDTMSIDTGMQILPKYNLPFVVNKIFPDSLVVEDERMDEGVFLIRYIDTINCKLITQKVIVIDSLECQSIESVPSYDSKLSESFSANDITLFPNPNNGFLSVRFGKIEEYFYSIISFEGKHIRSNCINKTELDKDGLLTLDLTNLPDGIYSIRIHNSMEISCIRFVIIH